MTENPSVPSPPGLPQLPSNATNTPTPQEESADSSGEIKCICDYTDDDGYTICCDQCETWQHIACMQLSPSDLPKVYLCSRCSPRDVDARKARDTQRMRRREEPGRGSRDQVKRKRSGTASHKKKESTSTAHIGTATSKSTNAERNGTAKVPSPRESQAPTSRKRTHRSTNPHPNGSANDSPAHTDRNGDAEEEVEIEKHKYEFLDISGESDKYSDDKIKPFLMDAVDLQRLKSTNQVDRCRRYSCEDFSAISFPKVAVRLLPNTSKLYSKSRWCLELHSSLSKGRPVALFKGEVGFQEAYMKDPINQYPLINHPKPYVMFHPDLPIYIDARRYGCDSRFVRRSCRPNVTISTIAIGNSTVSFGFFALDGLKSGTEITVGWDWNSSKEVQRLAAEHFDFSKLSTAELRTAAEWVHNLQENVGDCACGCGTDCWLDKIKKVAGFEVPVRVPLSNGLGGRKQRIKRNASTEPNASKEPTPDRNGLHSHFDDEERTTATSGVAKHKSRSRELTPSVPHDTAVDIGSMTGREARKFKDVLSRIEKQEQEDHQNVPSKRRKRNSTVSVTPVNTTSPTRENTKSADVTKKAKLPSSKEVSPVGTPQPLEVSVADASSGRRTSDSSEGSVRRRRQRTSNSPADPGASPVWSKSRRKVVSVSAQTSYVDASVQTDLDPDLPWWRLDQKPAPRPARPNLRKRLMQSLLRDREEAAACATTAQDKKRKIDAVDNSSREASPTKVAKITDHGLQQLSVSLDNVKDLQTATTSISVTEISKPATPIPVPQTPTRDASKVEATDKAGPALGDLFADSEKKKKDGLLSVEGARQRSRSPAKVSTDTDGAKSPALHLQLPPPSQTSPTSSIASAPSPKPIGNPPLFSPAVVSAVGGLSTPSPTKTKKLSLKDYGKRRHKAADGSEDKPPLKSTADAPTTTSLTFLNDRKLADILAPPTDAINPPTADTSSLDSKMHADPLEGVR